MQRFVNRKTDNFVERIIETLKIKEKQYNSEYIYQDRKYIKEKLADEEKTVYLANEIAEIPSDHIIVQKKCECNFFSVYTIQSIKSGWFKTVIIPNKK